MDKSKAQTETPTTPQPEETQQQIRQRAFELYVRRGKEDGHDWDDWFAAESEVMPKTKAA